MPATSYDFKDQVRDLEAGISLIIKDQPTLLSLVGISNDPIYQAQYEWMSDYLNSNIAVVAGAVDEDATEIQLAEGEGDKFRPFSLVYFEDEFMQVTAINGDVITVVRGFDGTQKVAIPAGAELRIVGRPQIEGAMPGQDESHDRLVDFNYTQIFERYAAVTGTQQAVRTHNVTDELQYQVEQRMAELAREMNDALIYGRRFAGSKGVPRMTGGLLYFAELKNAARENLAGEEVTAKALNDLMEKIYQRGGSANTILTNTAGARQISKLNRDAIRIEREEDTAGNYVATFVSDIVGGGIATIVVDKNMPKDKIVVFDRSILSIHPLAGRALWDEDATPKGADFFARQIRGEYGVKVKNAHEKIGILENVSTSVS